MTGSGAQSRWRRVLRYVFGGVMCLLALAAMRLGLHWYWAVVMLAASIFLILGRRRIFRAGVTRASGEVVCRYVPWFEGDAYILNIALPLIGAAAVAAGYAPGNPRWLLFVGFILLVLTPLFTSSAVRMWRRSFLRITPSALTIGVAASKNDLTEIARELVESITLKTLPNGVGGQWLQVEIAYHAVDSTETMTVLLGLQLSVQPNNLLYALAYWQDGDQDDPSELLDRIELILRGLAMAGV